MVDEPSLSEQAHGISANFGYYPNPCNIETEYVSIQTLPDHTQTERDIRTNPNVIKDWIYPGPTHHKDFVSEKILPYPCRIFGLPKTHVITLHKSNNREELDFVVWCLSFFVGMRLTTTEGGFLDATPIKPGKLVDFTLKHDSKADVIQLALNYIKSKCGDISALKGVEAVINALFLAQCPQSLSFENFQYLYMALDGCFKLIASSSNIAHSKRIQWMCEQFGISVPDWAKHTKSTPSILSKIRNSGIHEALFFGEPLGFSVYGGNQPKTNGNNIPLQMQALVCRLLVAILGKPEINYIKTPIDTRQIYSLKLGE